MVESFFGWFHALSFPNLHAKISMEPHLFRCNSMLICHCAEMVFRQICNDVYDNLLDNHLHPTIGFLKCWPTIIRTLLKDNTLTIEACLLSCRHCHLNICQESIRSLTTCIEFRKTCEVANIKCCKFIVRDIQISQ